MMSNSQTRKMRSFPAFLAALVFAIFLSVRQTAWAQPAEITHEVNVRVPMADGVELAADVYRPKQGGAFPVVLVRSPYSRSQLAPYVAIPLAQQGYAVVMQDVRGMGDSAGTFVPFINEKADGLATLDWLVEQPWCDGKVGMWGSSYLSFCALIVSPSQHPALKAVFDISGWGNSQRMTAPGGAMHLMIGVPWTLSPQISGQTRDTPVDWQAAFRHVPVTDIPAALGIESPEWESVVDLFMGDELARVAGVEGQYDRMQVPIYHLTGWYDFVGRDTLEVYEGIDRALTATTPGSAGRTQKLMVGPWHHDQQWGDETRVGDEDFGPDAAMGIERVMTETTRWFDHWLKGIDNGVMDEPAVSLFVMGVNEWRRFEHWPPNEVVYAKWYLDSTGDARSSAGNGSLSPIGLSTDADYDEFVYDPMDPVPTVGGANCHFFPSMLGVRDQSTVEARDDVLVYTSEVLDDDLTLIGPMQAVVYASTTGRHADITAKIVEVRADGYARIIDDGIRRGPDSSLVREIEPMEPGKVYRYTIQLGRTGIVLPAGSRLRVEVSSSNFPKYSRNPGTGESPERAAEFHTATQRIHHSQEYPSHVLLPVWPDR